MGEASERLLKKGTTFESEQGYHERHGDYARPRCLDCRINRSLETADGLRERGIASRIDLPGDGGAGFIGSNLCERCSPWRRVRCLDDLSTGKQSNVDLFTDHPDYAFIHGDIRDVDTCFAATQGVDYVLHQAARGSVPRSIEYPLVYEEINIRGTLNMLEASRSAGVRAFVYASSSSVYGDESSLPKQEGQEGVLLSPYAVTKRSVEEYGKLYTKLYGLRTYGLRYFNVFGRRQDPDGAYAAAIPKFIRSS